MIGGWVIKYLIEYFAGHSKTLAGDAYFTYLFPMVVYRNLFIIFTLFTLGIIYVGYEMELSVYQDYDANPDRLSLIIAVYSVTRPGAIEGVKYFLVPNFDHFHG